MELIILIVWAIFGFAAAYIGKTKGGNGCLWFAIRFLLGPIGLVIALLKR